MGAHLVKKKELSKMKKKMKTSSDQAGLDGFPPGGSLRSFHHSQPDSDNPCGVDPSCVNCGQRSLIG